MFCGHLLSVDEMLVQIGKRKRDAGSWPTPASGKKKKTPIFEIKESRSGKAGTEHVEQKSDKDKDEKAL
jgi:hypothetical protein